QIVILRDVRKHAQLDLRVIRSKHVPSRLGWNEYLADLTPFLQTNRNILEVRELAAEPARGSNRLPVIGVHLTGLRPHLFEQPLDVRRLQLSKRAVVQDLPYDFVVGRKALKHLGIRRVAGFGLLPSWQPQLLKQDLAKDR